MEEWSFWAYNCSLLRDVASRHPELKGGDVVVWVIAKLKSWEQAVEIADNFRALANLSPPRSPVEGFWHDKLLVPVVSSGHCFVSWVFQSRFGMRALLGWPYLGTFGCKVSGTPLVGHELCCILLSSGRGLKLRLLRFTCSVLFWLDCCHKNPRLLGTTGRL
jgi:hypothetical protein